MFDRTGSEVSPRGEATVKFARGLALSGALVAGLAPTLAADDTKLVTTVDGTTTLTGYPSDLSADGRCVLFRSDSADFVPNDENDWFDLFVRDLETGAVERVNVADDGSEDPGSGGVSPRGSISGDGRFVAFATRGELDPADVGDLDVYLRDRAAGTTTLVSRAPARVGTKHDSSSPQVSRDGSWVVFVSSVSNLVDGDTNDAKDVFAWERATGTITRVSTDAAGNQLDVASGGDVAISADGTQVAFVIGRIPAAVEPGNVFIKDRVSGALEEVDGDESGGSFASSAKSRGLSPDGRFVLFETFDGLVASDLNGRLDGYVRDRTLATVECVTLGTGSRLLAADQSPTGMSDDARRIAFMSDDDASGDDSNTTSDGFVFLRDSGVALRVTLKPQDQQSLSQSSIARLSTNGHTALFWSDSSNVWPGKLDGFTDTFVRVLSDVPSAWNNYGDGLDGRFGTPSLTLDALPRRNTTIGLHIGNSSGLYSSGVLFLGFASASLPTSLGGTLLVAPAATFPVPLSPWDNALVATVPSSGNLPGLHLYLQVLEVDPWAVKGVSFTAGLDLTIGD